MGARLDSPDPMPQDDRPAKESAPNDDGLLHWENFYQSYRKPGYIQGYEISHKLGGGVFGIVFKARKESIGKAYAIKFLKVDDPAVKRQVLHELEQVGLFAQVDHPNLVSIEDKGVVDGIPYIIMGYAGEETLKTRLEDGRLDTEDALRVFVQVARGVQALHEHSLIHFDLKPANIFLKGDIARVGDYGLSKLICESRMSLSFGRGTPYYMAPEMLQRRGDHRSDIYSLGVILYECLTGSVPFKGESEWEVLKGHEEKEVPWPADFDPAYRQIVARMLAKRPEERFESVQALLHELRAPGRLGESIVLDLAGASARAPQSFASSPSPAAAPVPRSEPPPMPPSDRDEAIEGAGRDDVVGAEYGAGIIGSLLRALVIALLLPARVIGIGLGRGLQLLISIPLAILRFIGKLSVVFLGGVMLFLLAFMLFAMFA